MKENTFYSDKKKWIPILIIIYTAAHWFLFIATGRWWQSWLFWNTSDTDLWELSKQCGRPSLFFLMRFVEALPGPVYRALTFLIFLACTFLLYGILKNWLNLSDRSCFWISAIYAIVPANDMRIIQGAFPYSLGVLFLMAGMYLLSVALNGEGLKWKYRIVEWILFLGAFVSLNSTLVFYGIVLLMILTKVRSIRILVLKYVDFILLPIGLFVIKCLFFPVYGFFSDYNLVTTGGIAGSIVNSFLAEGIVIKRIFANMIEINKKWLLLLLAIPFAGYVICNIKDVKEYVNSCVQKRRLIRHIVSDEHTDIGENLLIFVIGLVALYAGLFPYVEVRGSYDIRTRGLDGRDAILVAFGAAMIIYALVTFIFREKITSYILILIILCGIGYFNVYYISYQRDHYFQMGFRYHLEKNEDVLRDAYRVVVHPDFDYGEIHEDELSQLNGNVAMVYGDKTRCYSYNAEGVLNDETIRILKEDYPWFNMEDFDLRHRSVVDAIIEYSAGFSYVNTIKMKVFELVDEKRFYDCLASGTTMKIYMYGTPEYEVALAEDIRITEERKKAAK